MNNEDPYVVFERLYIEKAQPCVLDLFPTTQLNQGIHRTLSAAANHFHAGVILLLADLIGEDFCRAAAIAEYSWTALIVVDDTVDQQLIRRGRPAVWAEAGRSYATHSAWHASLEIARTVSRFEDRGIWCEGTYDRYLSSMQAVLAGQALRERLCMTDSISQIRRMMFAISSHLGGMIRTFVLPSASDFGRSLLRSLKTLSYAATLKNDLEDVFPPAPEYSPGGVDLKHGQVTYVLRAFYEHMTYDEQRKLEEILSGRRQSSEDIDDALKLMRTRNNVTRQLAAELAKTVRKAEAELEHALLLLPATVRDSDAADLLRAWTRSHAILGNSRIGNCLAPSFH